MKVLFVWPNKDQFGIKPIGLSLLSAVLKAKGHEVELFDTTFIDFGFKSATEALSKIKIFKSIDFGAYDVEKKKLDLKREFYKMLNGFIPDIVCVSALSDEIFIGLEISKLVKEWNNKTFVVWGNKAPTMESKKILINNDVDYICVGEGVEFLPEFVECISNGGDPKKIKNIGYKDNDNNIIINKLRPYYQELDALPWLDWSIYDHRQFLKPYDGKVYTGGDYMISWGCPNRCTYCINYPYRKLYGSQAGRYFRSYSVDRVISELEYLTDKWGIEFFKYNDEDFCLKPINYFSELAEKYADKISVPFTIMANAHSVNSEKVKLLKKMNCVSVTLGIETGNTKLRKEILKRRETKEDIIKAVKMFNDAGIRTSSFNMLGIPFETRDTVMETMELNKEAKVRVPNAGFFYPLEGTELRDIAIKEGFFDVDFDIGFHRDKPSLTFKDISSEELIKLFERFVLYIKMPETFYKYIKLSEASNEVGKRLTEELYKIYEECVLLQDGYWNDNGKTEQYIKRLESIVHSSC